MHDTHERIGRVCDERRVCLHILCARMVDLTHFTLIAEQLVNCYIKVCTTCSGTTRARASGERFVLLLGVDSTPWLTNFRAASVATNYEKYLILFSVVVVVPSPRQLE